MGARAPFGGLLKSSSGGGVAPSNYYAVAANGVIPLLEGLTTLDFEYNFNVGGPFCAITDGGITLEILADGIYVVACGLAPECTTAVALAPLVNVQSALAFTTADGNSLGEIYEVNPPNPFGAIGAVDQSQTLPAILLPYTTPPMALAAGDSLQWQAGATSAIAAGVILGITSESSALVVVKLG